MHEQPTNILAIGGLDGFVLAKVLNSALVLRLNFSAKTPPIANMLDVSCNMHRHPKIDRTLK